MEWCGAPPSASVLPPNMDGAVVTHTITLPAMTVAGGRRWALRNTFVAPAPAPAALSPSTKPPRITIIATIDATINVTISHQKSTQRLGMVWPYYPTLMAPLSPTSYPLPALAALAAPVHFSIVHDFPYISGLLFRHCYLRHCCVAPPSASSAPSPRGHH